MNLNQSKSRKEVITNKKMSTLKGLMNIDINAMYMGHFKHKLPAIKILNFIPVIKGTFLKRVAPIERLDQTGHTALDPTTSPTTFSLLPPKTTTPFKQNNYQKPNFSKNTLSNSSFSKNRSHCPRYSSLDFSNCKGHFRHFTVHTNLSLRQALSTLPL